MHEHYCNIPTNIHSKTRNSSFAKVLNLLFKCSENMQRVARLKPAGWVSCGELTTGGGGSCHIFEFCLGGWGYCHILEFCLNKAYEFMTGRRAEGVIRTSNIFKSFNFLNNNTFTEWTKYNRPPSPTLARLPKWAVAHLAHQDATPLEYSAYKYLHPQY